MGEFFKSRGNSPQASPQEIQSVISAVRKAEVDSRSALRVAMKKIDTDLQCSLNEVRRNVLADAESELRHIESLLADEKGRQKALAEISDFASQLSAITGNNVEV